MAPVASGSADCRKSVNKLPASLISGSYASSGGSSGNLVDRHFQGDATQRTLMRDRFELAGFEQLARSGMFDDRSGRRIERESARPCTRAAILTVRPK